MENTISTNVVKLDLQVILNNYKKPEFWSKNWLIIDTKWLSINWHITYINCKDNKIMSEVKITKINYKKGNKVIKSLWYYPSSDCQVIPINNPEYTQDHFEKNIYNAVLRVINSVEDTLTRYYKEFEDADAQDDSYIESLKNIAKAFLDENKVTNEDIREAYIDAYVSKMTYDRVSYKSKVIDNFRYKLLTPVYVYTSAWFDNEKDFEKYKAYDTKRKSEYEAMKQEIRLIQTEEWKNSMKQELEEI